MKIIVSITQFGIGINGNLDLLFYYTRSQYCMYIVPNRFVGGPFIVYSYV